MEISYSIAGYCRISVDEELDRDNTSIENQKAIISDFVKRKFANCTVDFYEDRDRSGYTFEQREGYQELRRKMLAKEYDILIVKDFSRFSRRNSKGLVELEDLRDAGMRIISIGDSIDYPTYDDWTAIQFRFLINEMPVTDTSKKVKSVIRRRQEEGKWICAVPYGYVMTNNKTMQFEIDEPSAEIVREIFRLYNEGWGYKRIANHLTDKHIPTPRMVEKMRKELNGEETKIQAKQIWSIVTVSEILQNDFYIGTLRQGKYKRKKINGSEEKQHETEHIVFENHHSAIVDYRVFAQAQEQMKIRSTSGYRGKRKFDNVYSGYLFCGDCGSPMFSMSRSNLAPAYICGSYHRRGKKACTSHHTRVDMLDDLLKSYLKKIRDNSSEMLERLQESIAKEKAETKSSKSVIETLEQQIEDARLEIKLLMRQQARDLLKHPDRADILEELYTEQIDDLTLRIDGLRNQLQMASDKHNTIVRVNRTAKTVLEIFDSIIEKDKLTKSDIDFIVQRIVVFGDRVEIFLEADVDRLLQYPTNQADDITETLEKSNDIDTICNSKGDILSVNVISNGDPLEIYTSSDGEVIFKKYSAINELSENATQIADITAKLASCPVVVFDRDHVVAVSGVPKKEFAERRVSQSLEDLMESRKSFYQTASSHTKLMPVEGVDKAAVACVPIITAGDVSGAVAFLENGNVSNATELQSGLVQAAAQFLSRQIEG